MKCSLCTASPFPSFGCPSCAKLNKEVPVSCCQDAQRTPPPRSVQRTVNAVKSGQVVYFNDEPRDPMKWAIVLGLVGALVAPATAAAMPPVTQWQVHQAVDAFWDDDEVTRCHVTGWNSGTCLSVSSCGKDCILLPRLKAVRVTERKWTVQLTPQLAGDVEAAMGLSSTLPPWLEGVRSSGTRRQIGDVDFSSRRSGGTIRP